MKGQLTTSEYLDFEEYQKLLRCLRKDKQYMYEAYAVLGFCSACRISDILKMKWKDVLKPECVVMEQKTGKSRRITFNEAVQKRMTDLYALSGMPDKESPIFLNPRTGRPITRQAVNAILKTFKERYRLDIGNISSHTFRKTFGRYVYEKGGRSGESLVLLNKILAHSSIQVTKTYIGITQDEVKSVFDSIAI